jgi:N-acetylglucosaminyl-diphospho-decaprenol L-rhamnosyltransferase
MSTPSLSRGVEASVIVPSLDGGLRLRRVLESLGAQTVSHQTIVVDNGSRDSTATTVAAEFPQVEIIRLEGNVGFARAVNIAAARAETAALILLNDDCVCEPEFVERLAAALDPSAGVVMAAGVLFDSGDPQRIDTAGMELDATLLVFDYLNGERADALAQAADPIGPSGAAAAFDRMAFLGAGGFDERLFAYWEDVDLVLRLRRVGGRCRLARGANGLHAHSATLHSGSQAKNYLIGFGRGYLLRKWSVLSTRRIASILARDVTICAGQIVFDRTVAGIRGRLEGYAAAAGVGRYPYPDREQRGTASSLLQTLARRSERRARLRRAEVGGGVSALGSH